MPDALQRVVRLLLAIALSVALSFALPALSSPVAAQSTAATITTQPAFAARANDALAFFQGADFTIANATENLLNAIPDAQAEQLRSGARAQYGPVRAIAEIRQYSDTQGDVLLRFDEITLIIALTIEPAGQRRIAGFFITGAQSTASSLQDIASELVALPGRTGLLVQRIDRRRDPAIAINAEQPFAIGSTFKLYILAELDRAVRAGERRWSDVVSLGPLSHPSGMLQEWPVGTPMTLRTLATLMISISDNSATDTLIRVIGQERLAAIVRETGHSNPAALYPFLMTRQATALKMPGNADLRADFLASDEAAQAALIARADRRLGLDTLDFEYLTSAPRHIETMEWFATLNDIARLMRWLDRNASAEARAIMALNTGVSDGAAAQWRYLGYKGGSEAGVLSLNFLLENRDGETYAVSAQWNDRNNAVQEARLFALMERLITLLVEE